MHEDGQVHGKTRWTRVEGRESGTCNSPHAGRPIPSIATNANPADSRLEHRALC